MVVYWKWDRKILGNFLAGAKYIGFLFALWFFCAVVASVFLSGSGDCFSAISLVGCVAVLGGLSADWACRYVPGQVIRVAISRLVSARLFRIACDPEANVVTTFNAVVAE